MKNTWLAAFALISAVNLAGVAFGNQTLVFLTKPLLMPSLAIWLAMETRHKTGFLKKAIFTGLAFATLGDVLLLSGDQPTWFMLGLAAFLCTHFSYIAGFSSLRKWNNGFLRQQPWWLLPFAAFTSGLLWWLWPGIPAGMQAPVSVYAMVITFMALSVVNLNGNIAASAYRMLATGAVLFMLSDSLIAVSRFGNAFPSPGALIMGTYIVGQFLIVKGVSEVLTGE